MVETHKNSLGYKILTNTGYKEFAGISFNGIQDIYEVKLDNDLSVLATDDHEIFVDWFVSKPVSKLKVGNEVLTSDGYNKIVSITPKGKQNVYDILEVDGVNRFYANDILVHNCKFIGKSGTLVESSIMRELMDRTKNITYEFLIDGDIRFYKNLDKNMKYLVAIDPAMGVTGDFAAIQVFEFPTFIQVAEWMDDTTNQNDQVDKLKNLIEWMYTDLKTKGCRSPEIYWSLENNSVGEGFICSLREKAFNNGNEKPQDYIKRGVLITENGNKRMGFTTSKRTKTMACAQLKNFLENRRIVINSKEYVQQLSNFTMKEVNYSADGQGLHDDLITASLTIMLMYIQCKNSLDLTMPIDNNVSFKFHENKDFELPFMFVKK